MATSRSSSRRPSSWTAGALLYSGRPNPVWKVDGRRARRLVRLWTSLDVAEGPRPRSPSLGYRGCILREDTHREWTAYGGVVTLSASGRLEMRRDDQREFERGVLATAPEGVPIA
jgi:hypothetical protein